MSNRYTVSMNQRPPASPPKDISAERVMTGPTGEARQDAPDAFLLVSRRQVELLKRAIDENPALVHRCRWSGVSLLHRAVSVGDAEIVSLLLERGADPNERAAWGWYSPLHVACKRGDVDIIWLLLDRGAKWTAVDKAKKTPLQWGVRAGKASISYRVDQQLHAKVKLALAKRMGPHETSEDPQAEANLENKPRDD